MLSPALALSLLACATAHTLNLGELPADLPPWGAALFAMVGAMEGEIATMKTTISTQTDMLKMQGETIADNSARIQELETRSQCATTAIGRSRSRCASTYHPNKRYLVTVCLKCIDARRTIGNSVLAMTITLAREVSDVD